MSALPGSSQATVRTGLLYGLAAYGLWGIVPLYFKSVVAVPPRELLAHRVIWSAVLLLLVLMITGRIGSLRSTIGSRVMIKRLVLSSLLIGLNWYVYIYSVLTGQIMQGSLGYFILPLVNVTVGLVFFKERMRAAQWFALSLASLGVGNLIWQAGIFPWIAITLAISFSLYGLVRKQTAVDGTIALAIETLILTPLACFCVLLWYSDKVLVFGNSFELDVLIVCSGIVTSIPLLCFAQAVRRLKLITIGFLQYISPSLAFALAVLKYDEPFTAVHQVSYGLIWFGLLVFVVDAQRAARLAAASDR